MGPAPEPCVNFLMNSLPAINPANLTSGRGVIAVLGPTNTGKTHLAIERLLGHRTGVIGLPLRLLAREVYQRVVERVGAEQVALITGEEKIVPENARFQVCTVEAMPEHTDADFVAIDEVQLATDLERGHIFTDRLLHLRGRRETMLLGAETLRPVLEQLLPGINIITRPRMSTLSYAGQKKITRLPARSAIVAFSADEVYAIAELIRRKRGGAAVVLGSLSPRTRNAQVEIYQSGDVDFLVATDAIGMGLNLDVNHVAFAQEKKFDGHQHRRLTAQELAQIAGRAGRHTLNGTFGVTGTVEPFEDELVAALESHTFAPAKIAQWRNRKLNFDSLTALKLSLEQPSSNALLAKTPPATDQRTLDILAGDEAIQNRVAGQTRTKLLWQVCQTPDFRRIAPANHADMLGHIFKDICDRGAIDEDWFKEQVEQTNNTEGDIDTLSNRIAHIRTWTYLSNRGDWLSDPQHWQEKTREIEDHLSDALHEALTKRFVDRRTSVLMKRLRENAMLEAEISKSGDVTVEGHLVGQLQGFRFTADKQAEGEDAKAAKAAAQKALAAEIERRAERLCATANADLAFGGDGVLRWSGAPVGRLIAGEDALKPGVVLLADEQLSGTARDKVEARLVRWIKFHIETILKPLADLSASGELTGIARGLAFRLVENFGVLDRRSVAEDVRGLDQETRGTLRRLGVRFGAYHIFIPTLLKPAPAALSSFLWALKHDKLEEPGLGEVSQILATGRTSTDYDQNISQDIYRLSGYRVLGKKAVRIDILERLADLLRPAIGWREEKTGTRPDGAYSGNSFFVTPGMLSILGATHEDMELVLKALGYRGQTLPALDIETKIAAWVAKDLQAETPSPMVLPSDSDQPDGEKTETETAEITDAVKKPGDEKSEAETPASEPAEDVETASEKQTGSTPTEAPDEPKTITIWRPGGSDRAKGKWSAKGRSASKDGASNLDAKGDNQGKPGGGKPGGRDGRNNRNDGNSHRGGHKGKHKPKPTGRPSKPLDPDSPFAKLAALKASLENKG